jgi:DNA repair protein RecN (Recombination protein N)
MLRRLAVRDLALVERASLELAPGLCVLTGETGAGKSLLVAALAALRGGRTSGDLVRKGAEVATVEGVFDNVSPGAEAGEAGETTSFLTELGLDLDDEERTGELILRRHIGRDGRSRAWINDQAVTLSTLRRLGSLLLDLHGQHEHQLLLDESEHTRLLDESGGLTPLRQRLSTDRARLRAARTALENAVRERRTLAGMADELRATVDEIEALDPGENEIELLRGERETLRHGEKIIETLRAAGQLLAEEDGSALERIGVVEGMLRNLEHLDSSLAATREQLFEARLLVEEAVRRAERRLAGFDRDPARIEVVEDRLAALARLVRRHGSVAAAREAAAAARAELSRLDTEADDRSLADRLVKSLRDTIRAAVKLSTSRAKARQRLSHAVAAELRVLGFPGGAFEAELVRSGSPLPALPSASRVGSPQELIALADAVLEAVGESGCERVRFLIAPNPGEGRSALTTTAAGGELARLMLALRTALRGRGGAGVLVFDEVDQGVGGVVLDAVADRLERLARDRQILCVTHQARIAARAHLHLRVDKEVRKGRTVTRLEPLRERSARLEELERLLAGREPGPRAAAHAEELYCRHAPRVRAPV